MGYYFDTSEDLETDSLEHHQILGAKWGQKNGPPYPLGSGDHSSAEKSAAKAAGVSVGSDSGKGSIENVKKKRSKSTKKKPLTPEEKRQLALDAAKSGDKKKIAKNIDQLSTEELRDAQARAQLKDQLTRKDPSEQKMSKAEVEKQEAIRSGNKELVKQYADKMTYNELQEAMNKVDLMAKLNRVEPKPSAMDKLDAFSKKVDNFRQIAERGVNAYNLAAKVYNSTHKDGTQWPVINNEKPKEKSPEEKTAEALAKALGRDVAKTAKENNNNKAKQEEKKSHKEESDEKLKNDIVDYKNQKKLEREKAKIDEKEAKRAEKEAAKKNPQPDTVNKLKLSRLSDFDDDISFEDLITDEARDLMNRKVS